MTACLLYAKIHKNMAENLLHLMLYFSIMRKKFLNRLQNGYKLVYLMYMNDLNLLETERRTVP